MNRLIEYLRDPILFAALIIMIMAITAVVCPVSQALLVTCLAIGLYTLFLIGIGLYQIFKK